jgi:RNA polymerase sigma-70 factor, ECF subfamily
VACGVCIVMTMTTAGVEADFLRQADPYRRELFAHCYRMLGSTHDAEDLVQETYLRAWRAYHRFEGKSSLRTWLYRIATNVCLTALETRSRRPMPTGLGAPSANPDDALVEQGEVPWLEPVPDALAGVADTDPAAIVASRSSVRLALVAALQHLPPRQRAVLILRDVLRWKAAEVAEALETSTAAVNSILQRARAQIQQAGLTEEGVAEPTDPEQRQMLDRYAQAMENKDVAAIVKMLTDDARWEMPPFVGWYQGREAIGRLIDLRCPAGPGQLRMVPTRANGQPAFGMYILQEGVFFPFQLQVLDVADGRVRHVAAFFDHSLFPLFGLPESIEEDSSAPVGSAASVPATSTQG